MIKEHVIMHIKNTLLPLPDESETSIQSVSKLTDTENAAKAVKDQISINRAIEFKEGCLNPSMYHLNKLISKFVNLIILNTYLGINCAKSDISNSLFLRSNFNSFLWHLSTFLPQGESMNA
tara:strand:- start:16103 stop:16465 length:363 start_codon:yes stop_codon:yes gene_type:complete